MIGLAERKLEFIQEVSQIRDEEDLARLEETLQKIRGRQQRFQKYRTPMAKSFDPEAVKRQRNFKGHDKTAFMDLVREIDAQEPVEELLALLTK